MAARLLRLHRRPSRSSSRSPVAVVPHPEDLVEHDEPVPAPHLPVGGARRHAGCFTHFPPADTYGSGQPAPRSRTPLATSSTRAAANRSMLPFGCGDGGGGPTREMLARAARAARPRRVRFGSRWSALDTFFDAGRGRVRRLLRCGSASSTSRCTAAPTRARRAPSAATGAASTCCARPSCGLPRQPCASGPSTRSAAAGPSVEGGAATTSSTTSFPAPPSAGCTVRPSRSTPPSRAELEEVIAHGSGRARR